MNSGKNRVFLSCLYISILFFGGVLPFRSYGAQFQSLAELQKNLTCILGKIQFAEGRKTIEKKMSYCFDYTRGYLWDKKCYESMNCSALQKKKAMGIETNSTKFSSPGFIFCKIYGGIPQIIRFHDGVKWWPLDWCKFQSDGSFVNTGSLLVGSGPSK